MLDVRFQEDPVPDQHPHSASSPRTWSAAGETRARPEHRGREEKRARLKRMGCGGSMGRRRRRSLRSASSCGTSSVFPAWWVPLFVEAEIIRRGPRGGPLLRPHDLPLLPDRPAHTRYEPKSADPPVRSRTARQRSSRCSRLPATAPSVLVEARLPREDRVRLPPNDRTSRCSAEESIPRRSPDRRPRR